MRDPVNCREVSALSPDWMGFIFYEKSPRFVGENFVMPALLSEQTKRVGVFVNESPERISQLSRLHSLDYVQLHGDENVELVKRLKDANIHIIKAFRIDKDFDFTSLTKYAPSVKYFLFDTKGQQYGGNGYRFDWSLLEQYEGSVPFLLSGGISLEHAEAIQKFQHPNFLGIDINSGVELSPGLKDIDKIKSMIKTLNEIS